MAPGAALHGSRDTEVLVVADAGPGRARRAAGAVQSALQPEGLQSPRLVISGLLSLVVTAFVAVPVWPGLMSYDSLYAYEQSIDGVETSVWPPVHDYMFFVSRLLTGGPEGVLLTQAFVLFASVAAVLAMFTASRARHVAGFVSFVALFFWFPTLIGTAIVIWKDVPLASFSILALALWLTAVRRGSHGFVVAAAAALCVAVSVRHNGLPLLLPFFLLMVAIPVRKPALAARGIVVLALSGAVVVAVASTVWRLPDFQRLPSASGGFTGVQTWDLVGMSACAGTNLLPDAYQGERPHTVDELRRLYDPRHANLTLLDPPPGVRPLPDPGADVSGPVAEAWRSAVSEHTGCYLDGRSRVFAEQMGVGADDVFYPTHSGIDANRFGLALAHPDAALERIQGIGESAGDWWRRPAWLYLLAGLAAGAALVLRLRSRPLVVVLGLGAAAYIAPLFFLAPAADARYIFPSNVFCALLIVVTLMSLPASRVRLWRRMDRPARAGASPH